ncbi:MAG: hypothetical protein ABUL73_01510 [Alphaproteobacteria bacterium]
MFDVFVARAPILAAQRPLESSAQFVPSGPTRWPGVGFDYQFETAEGSAAFAAKPVILSKWSSGMNSPIAVTPQLPFAPGD